MASRATTRKRAAASDGTAANGAASAEAANGAAGTAAAGTAANGAAVGGFQLSSIEDAIKKKGMWAGALTRVEIKDLAGLWPVAEDPAAVVARGGVVNGDAPGAANGADPPTADGVGAALVVAKDPEPPARAWRLAPIPRTHTPALLKVFDEIIVNASDHARETARLNPKQRSKHITRIAVQFNPANGAFSCENDGPGIPVLVHPAASALLGHETYIPEMAFAICLAGTNVDRPKGSIKGGVNGLGGKIANLHSRVFRVETYDAETRLHYAQVFRDRLKARGAPEVRKGVAGDKPRTKISLLPAYAALDYAEKTHPGAFADFEAWLRWRVWKTAAYVGPRVAVTFNGEACPTTTAAGLARVLAPDGELFVLPMKAKEGPLAEHPWDVAVVLTPGQKKFAQLSVINGVVTAKGAHFAHIKDLIKEAAVRRLQIAAKDTSKTLTVAEACKSLTLVCVAAIPDSDWQGQRKDELVATRALVAPLQPVAATIAELGKAIARQTLAGAEVGARPKRVKLPKFTRAREEGGRRAAQCRLVLGEGDSALGLLRRGLTLGKKNPGGPSFEFYAIYSLGGVIMNALQRVIEVEAAGGETVLVRNEALKKNEVLNGIVQILGLEYGRKYETAAERARLRYGGVVVAVDQDLAGAGKILGLVLTFFHTFWPALLRAGYVARLMTPVIRVYPPRGRGVEPALREFFYEDDFRRWAVEQAAALAGGGDAAGDAAGPAAVDAEAAVGELYDIQYYKGLATHDDDEALDIFRRFHELTFTFSSADGDREVFDAYFGPSSAARKALLATPVAPLAPELAAEIAASRRIPCRTHLESDTKAYKIDAIECQIPSPIDGLTPARRKVLAAALEALAGDAKIMKVFEFGGDVVSLKKYHKGSDSLYQTITCMGQRFLGAYRFPYLIGVGEFGSRHGGGNNAGAPRYISVRLAKTFARAMLGISPATDDRFLLPHKFVDGKRAEPAYFVPVLPMAALESGGNPSEGWRYLCHARDFDQAVALVRGYIAGDPRLLAVAPPDGGDAPIAPADITAEVREAYPLGISRWRYGEHLAPEDRASLVRPYKGELTSFGCYERRTEADGTVVVTITELPLGVSPTAFLADLQGAGKTQRWRDRQAFVDLDEIADLSSADTVEIHVPLRRGGWEEINERYGDAETDPIEDFFKLRKGLKPYLNFYDEGRGVAELGQDYHALVFRWLPHRRELYRRRLERRVAHLRLQIWTQEEVLRYLAEASGLDLSAVADGAAAAKLLASRGYVPINAAVVGNPGYAAAADFERLARGAGANYKYLLDCAGRKQLIASRKKREAALGELRAALADAETRLAEQPFAGASLWAADVDAVLAAIAAGEASDWKFRRVRSAGAKKKAKK